VCSFRRTFMLEHLVVVRLPIFRRKGARIVAISGCIVVCRFALQLGFVATVAVCATVRVAFLSP